MDYDEYIEIAQQVCDEQAGEGEWEVRDDSILVCPCGNYIEWDGECPEGHVSPIRAAGFI